MNRTVRRALACLFLLGAFMPSGVLLAAEQTILGSQLVVKDPGVATRRSVTSSGREPASSNTIIGDPTAGGGVLEVMVNGSASSAQRFVLPQGLSMTGQPFWSAVGTSGFLYRDGKGQNGPVKRVKIQRTSSGNFSISVAVNAKFGTVNVVPPNPGTDGCVALTLGGGDRYSIAFGVQSLVKNNGTKLFAAKKPLVEGVCPALPTPTPSATPTPTPTPTATGTPDPCETVVFTEAFTGANGSPWPAPWVELENSINPNPDIQGNAGRFKPGPLPMFMPGRVYAPMSERDAEALFTVEFEDLATQGFGFYLRQNGGHVQISSTHGEGYAVFVEGFLGYHGIGLWRETDGVEERLPVPGNLDNSLSLSNGVRYRVRFRVSQMNASTTMLRARIWPEASPEPSVWNVTATDNHPSLQNVSAGIAVDSYSHLQPNPVTAYLRVDDIVVTRPCNPLYGIDAVTTVSEAFTFSEGPLWRDDALLFTDILANTIHELTPPSTIGVFRSPSGQANGLATDINGDLLAAEHLTRRVSRTDSMGTVTTLVDTYMGDRFNSPNDIAVRSDGTIYFTDPAYGLANPLDRELPFNGLFRRTPAGVLTAEWMGATSSGPNGVSLSPDETVLYMAETAAGTIQAWDVAVDGALSNQRTFATGLFIPDGTCVDTRGNLYVATWANNVTVFSPLGDRWGTIGIPRQATNCAFGGTGNLTMYVTAHEGLYSTSMAVPGIP